MKRLHYTSRDIAIGVSLTFLVVLIWLLIFRANMP